MHQSFSQDLVSQDEIYGKFSQTSTKLPDKTAGQDKLQYREADLKLQVVEYYWIHLDEFPLMAEQNPLLTYGLVWNVVRWLNCLYHTSFRQEIEVCVYGVNYWI